MNNFTIFAPNVAQHEVVNLKITEVKKNFALAKITKLIKESEYRVSNHCVLTDGCSHARYLDFNYDYQIMIKEKQLSKLFNREVEVIRSQYQFNYRNKIEFFYKNNQFNIYTDSNSLEPVSNSVLAKQEINNLLSPLLESFNQNKKANISSVIFRYSELNDEIMLIFVSKEENRHQLRIAQEIVGYSQKIKSIILNIGESNNYLFNEKEVVLYGENYIIDTLMNKNFKVTSKSFYQVNPEQTKKLYQTAIDFADLKESDNVADLYCGVGTIGIIVSDYVNHVLGVEVVSDAVKAAKNNIDLNEISNVDIVEHDLNKDFSILEDIDVAIVDPPRSGLSKNIISNLIDSGIKKIVYISCDPYTQKRDINIFKENGYSLTKIKAVDMFINTHHVESVVLIEKRRL